VTMCVMTHEGPQIQQPDEGKIAWIPAWLSRQNNKYRDKVLRNSLNL